MNSKSGNTDAITTISSATEEVNVKDMSEQLKNEKQEEVQKLKKQITSLDSKISESEKLVERLKEKTFVPKLDIEAIRKNNLSSLKGTWRITEGREWQISDSGVITDEKGYVIILEVNNSLSNLYPTLKNKYVAYISAKEKDIDVRVFDIIATPGGTTMSSDDNEKFTDNTNRDEDRLFAGNH